MKYTNEFLAKLTTGLYEQAEALANSVSDEGGREKLTVMVDDEYFEFTVAYEVENYRANEEENSVDYKCTVTCVEVPEVNDRVLIDYFHGELYLETLYEG